MNANKSTSGRRKLLLYVLIITLIVLALVLVLEMIAPEHGVFITITPFP